MKARIWEEHLAPDEWGSDLMKRIADERFAKDASIDKVRVHEHGGWYLSWNRAGVCVGTANDMAILCPEAREWGKQFTGGDVVGYTRRGPKGCEHTFDDYYPKIAQVA